MNSTANRKPAAKGTGAIDHEHDEITQLIHEFDSLLCRGGLSSQGGVADEVIDLFAVVIAHIKAHFATEEQFMLDIGYDDYQTHKHDHDRLVEELEVVMTDYERGIYAYHHLILAKRITEWFAVHFTQADAPMLEFAHWLESPG